jgi:uncharacterized DUF497 family protein
MEIEFDPQKCRENARRRGLPFSMVERFDFETALIFEDTRIDYGERRWIALGLIAQRVFVVAFTWRDARLRVISFRKANVRESERYEQARS